MDIAARNVMTRRFGSLAPRVNRRCAVAIRAKYGPNSQPQRSASPAVPPGYQQQQFYQGSQYPGSYSGQPAPAPPAGYQGVGTNNLPFTPYQGPPPAGTPVNSGYAPLPPQNAVAPQYQPQQQQGVVGLARTNPGRDTQNSVTLQGRIKGPTLDVSLGLRSTCELLICTSSAIMVWPISPCGPCALPHPCWGITDLQHVLLCPMPCRGGAAGQCWRSLTAPSELVTLH